MLYSVSLETGDHKLISVGQLGAILCLFGATKVTPYW